MLGYNSEVLKILKRLFNTQEVYTPPMSLSLAISRHNPNGSTMLKNVQANNASKYLPSKQKVIIYRDEIIKN